MLNASGCDGLNRLGVNQGRRAYDQAEKADPAFFLDHLLQVFVFLYGLS
jgi:hypothetical protein